MFIHIERQIYIMSTTVQMMGKNIFQRVCTTHQFNNETKRDIKGGGIGIFKVGPEGFIEEEYEAQGYMNSRNVQKAVYPFFKEFYISNTKESPCIQLASLDNGAMEICGPLALANSEELLEWAVFCSVVDIIH